jgi:hypothetical protein
VGLLVVDRVGDRFLIVLDAAGDLRRQLASDHQLAAGLERINAKAHLPGRLE